MGTWGIASCTKDIQIKTCSLCTSVLISMILNKQASYRYAWKTPRISGMSGILPLYRLLERSTCTLI
ncbi:hypothetical protein Leryth_014775, partial [Lithospermum erythrorhizon]